MSRPVGAKWRPSLGLVVAVVLGAVLGLAFGGIVAVRYLWPYLGYREAVFAVFAVVFIATIALGWGLVRLVLRPVSLLAARSGAIKRSEEGSLDPLPHYGTSEFQMLGQSMLEMGRVLQNREAVVRSYADHVTHEMRSPLTVLRGAAELLDSDLPADERRRLVERIGQATDRMMALLEAQRELARAQEPMPAGQTVLADLVEEWQIAYPDLDIAMRGAATIPLSKDAVRLVIQHLLANAAVHGARRVTLECSGQRVVVTDDGPGISAGNRDRIFEPFFTTRRNSGGTGMGLPIVRRMLEAHGGSIALLPTDEGTAFEIRF